MVPLHIVENFAVVIVIIGGAGFYQCECLESVIRGENLTAIRGATVSNVSIC